MEQDEREEDGADVCSACGAQVAADAVGAYGFGAENVLCARCAAARGGRYDSGRDRWLAEPDVSDLGDEAYGASPHERERRRRD